jgi:hypothetical protein
VRVLRSGWRSEGLCLHLQIEGGVSIKRMPALRAGVTK